jgi:hypothetical protein
LHRRTSPAASIACSPRSPSSPISEPVVCHYASRPIPHIPVTDSRMTPVPSLVTRSCPLRTSGPIPPTRSRRDPSGSTQIPSRYII